MRFPIQRVWRNLIPGAVAVALVSCASGVRVGGDWEPDVNRDQTFSRVLVIGLAADPGVRCDFESFLATQIRASGAEARSSCMMMKTTEPLTFESVSAVVEEYGADAVLATSLVQGQQAAAEGGTNETRGGLYFQVEGAGYTNYYRGGYGVYGVPTVYGQFKQAEVVTSVEGEAEIQSMLYATATESLVYTINTRAKGMTSRDNALAAITPPIAGQLKSAGLIR